MLVLPKNKEVFNLLAHIPCGGVVVFDDHGGGICPECGTVIKVRISTK